MVNQRSLQREFAIMSFLSLPQSKGVFLRSACDLVTNGCGLPYNNQIIVAIAEQTSIMILCLGQLLTDRQNVIFLYKVCASATSQAFGFRTLPSHTSAMPISWCWHQKWNRYEKLSKNIPMNNPSSLFLARDYVDILWILKGNGGCRSKPPKVGIVHTYNYVDQVPIAKAHLLPAAMMRRIILQNGKSYMVFSLPER